MPLRAARTQSAMSNSLQPEARHGASAASGPTLSLPYSPRPHRAFAARDHTPMEALPFWCVKAKRLSSDAKLIRGGCGFPDNELVSRAFVLQRRVDFEQ